MPQRSWKELVEEGQRLLEEEELATSTYSWHWCDLALEVEPMGKTGVNTGSYDRLRRWADEIGWFAEGRSFETLRKYREAADAWPGGSRFPSASWSAHYALRNHPDRFTLIREARTVTDAKRLGGYKVKEESAADRIKTALADPTVARTIMADPEVRHLVDEARAPEDRAEQARRLVRDPAVARHVVQDNTARSAMARAAKEMEEESAQRQRERAPGLVSMSDFYQATGELSRMRQAGMKSLDAMRRVDLADDQRDSLTEDHGRVKLVSAWIDSYLESGDHSFDRELDALLREET